MSSDLCERYAFIEHKVPLEQEKTENEIIDDDDDDDEDYEDYFLKLNSPLDQGIVRTKQVVLKPTRQNGDEYFINNIPVCGYEYSEYLRTGKCKYDIDNKYELPRIATPIIKQEEIKEILNIYNIDIKKCLKNALYYSKYDLPVFTVMDKVKVFNKDEDTLKTGIYYIESKRYFPLRGNGWYSLPMIDYCLQNNIINLDDIKYCVQCLVTIPCDYYNELIDYC